MSETIVRSRPKASVAIALLWMCGALMAFTLMAIAGRQAARSIDSYQMMIWRGYFSLVTVILMLLVTGRGLLPLRTHVLHLHAFRNTVHFAAQFAWIHALTLIPLAELFALELTTPLWIAVLAPLVLAERLTAGRLAAAIIGFAGTLVVVLMPEAARASGLAINIGTALALAAAIGYAISLMTTKHLTRSEDVFTILLYMALIQSAFSAALAQYAFVIPETNVLGWLFLLGSSGIAAHFCIAQAFARADAIIVAPMDFLRLPLIAFVGAQLYGEALDPWVMIGGTVVIAANALNLWSERRRSPTVA
jgi:drug/metabolite transporter (DMT)-like permease